MRSLVGLSFSASFALYAFAAAAGVAVGRCAGKPVDSNILRMFDESDPLASTMRLCLTIVLLLSLPLICLPCRNMLARQLGGPGASPPLPQPRPKARRQGGADGATNEPADPADEVDADTDTDADEGGGADGTEGARPARLGDGKCRSTGGSSAWPGDETASGSLEATLLATVDDGPSVRELPPDAAGANEAGAEGEASGAGELSGELSPPARVRLLLSSSVMAGSMAVAASVDDVSRVWGFLGATCGILLAYVLPAAAYVRLRRTPTNRRSSVKWHKRAAFALAAIGLALMPLCLFEAVSAERFSDTGGDPAPTPSGGNITLSAIDRYASSV